MPRRHVLLALAGLTFAGGCGGAGASRPVALTVEGIPNGEASSPKRSSRGACATTRGVRYAAPEEARLLATPEATASLRVDRTEAGAPGWRAASRTTAAPVAALWAAGTDVLAVGSGHLLRSHDGARSFDEGTAPIPASAIWASSSTDIFMIAGRTLAHSADRGATWSVHEPFALDAHVQAFAGSGPDLYAAGGDTTRGGYLAHSVDHGGTWHDASPSLPGGWITALAVADEGPTGEHVIVAGGYERGTRREPILVRSTDCGATWTRVATPSGRGEAAAPIGQEVVGLCALPSKLVVATTSEIAVSSDAGATFATALDLGGAKLLGLACRGQEILAVGEDGLVVASRDGGGAFTTERLDALFDVDKGFSRPSLRAVQITDDGSTILGGGWTGSVPATRTAWGSLFVRDGR